jgi:hypothetical protein
VQRLKLEGKRGRPYMYRADPAKGIFAFSTYVATLFYLQNYSRQVTTRPALFGDTNYKSIGLYENTFEKSK